MPNHYGKTQDTSGQSRRARIRSNWCHACRQRFSESEYKLHIMTEHQYDSYRMYADDSKNENNGDISSRICNKHEYTFSNKNIKQEIHKNTSPKSPRKKGKFSTKLQADPICSITKIKAEPADEPSNAYKSKVSPKKDRKINAKSLFIICNKCGMKCKSQRGLKIHLGTTHKRKSSNNDKQKNSHKEVKTKIVQSKQVLPDEAFDQCKNYGLSSTNKEVKTKSVQSKQVLPDEAFDQCKNSTNNQSFLQNISSSLNQNSQTELIDNQFPIQTQPLNNIGIGNQANIQLVPICVNQNPPVETILIFDHESENYIKWLKKFINKCKMHKYPLTPMLCQSISHINQEITDALANPTGSMKKRSNHFYFMKIKGILSEIMMGQMRHTLNVVKR